MVLFFLLFRIMFLLGKKNRVVANVAPEVGMALLHIHGDFCHEHEGKQVHRSYCPIHNQFLGDERNQIRSTQRHTLSGESKLCNVVFVWLQWTLLFVMSISATYTKVISQQNANPCF